MVRKSPEDMDKYQLSLVNSVPGLDQDNNEISKTLQFRERINVKQKKKNKMLIDLF